MMKNGVDTRRSFPVNPYLKEYLEERYIIYIRSPLITHPEDVDVRLASST
jgi:hypothetical protein